MGAQRKVEGLNLLVLADTGFRNQRITGLPTFLRRAQ